MRLDVPSRTKWMELPKLSMEIEVWGMKLNHYKDPPGGRIRVPGAIGGPTNEVLPGPEMAIPL